MLSCSRVASLLLSLHPRTRTRFLWEETWFSGREKSRTVLGAEITVDVPSLKCCFSPNTSSQIARCVLARWRDESMRHSSTCLVSFVAHVNGGSSKHFYNKPNWQSDLQAPKKTIIIVLNLDLLMRAFFFLGDWGLFQCMDYLLVSGSYWEIEVSSHVITFRKNQENFQWFQECQHSNSLDVPFARG